MRVRRNGFSLVLDYERHIDLLPEGLGKDEEELLRLSWVRSRAIIKEDRMLPTTTKIETMMLTLADVMENELEKVAEHNPVAERWRK